MNTLKHKISDVLTIARGVWFILLFLFLGMLAFVFVEQGQDMLFAIMDDFETFNFILSLVALAMWAVQTSFGTRILLMFSNISFYAGATPAGHTDESWQQEIDRRIHRRKRLVTFAGRILFFAPYVIMSVGYLKAFFTYDHSGMSLLPILLIILFLWVSAYVVYRLTFFTYNRVFRTKQSTEELHMMGKLNKPESIKTVGNVRHLFRTAVLTAVAFIFIYAFLPVSVYQRLGSVHLITMSFGCWIAIAYGLDYIDKTSVYFVKGGLLLYISVASYFNHDHPARKADGQFIAPALSVTEYFEQWRLKNFTPDDSGEQVVFFVSAEGGASRSGYWVSQVLAHLHEAVPDFTSHIFSYSSVSGGTLGVNTFNAIHKWQTEKQSGKKYPDITKTFYEPDYLAPVTGRMVFGDVLNLLSWNMIFKFDRTTALEESWEKGFAELGPGHNLMSESFNEVNKTGPAIFINSTMVETGQRALMSNVKINHSFSNVVNMQQQLSANVHYSTAILFSARFPYLTPAAAIQTLPEDKTTRRHFVDGGYFDNMGNITTMEVVRAVKNYCSRNGIRIKPVVILITNDEPGKPVTPLLFGNELMEPLAGFMNVRSGHTQEACSQMYALMRGGYMKGDVIQFNMALSGDKVPMNWFLSEKAKSRVDSLFNDSMYLNRMANIKRYLSH